MGKKNKGKKSKPLTGLAAALVKSGHLSEKKAKTLARGQRREDKKLGRDGVALRQAEKQQAAAEERAAEAAADRAREETRKATQADEGILRAIRDGLNPSSAGGRRWFFAARDGRRLQAEGEGATHKESSENACRQAVAHLLLTDFYNLIVEQNGMQNKLLGKLDILFEVMLYQKFRTNP